MRKVLAQSFFKSRNTPALARKLVGKFLVRRYRGKTRAYQITEVEAYDGFRDKASHAHRGMTKRNKIMFGKAGHWYVYFTYGMHWMLNIVTGPEKYPAAILIRSIEADIRGSKRGTTQMHLAGPARLTKALHIDKKLNGKVATIKSGLWIEDRGLRGFKIKMAPRIGVAYAGPVWSKKKYRFLQIVHGRKSVK
ncbi:MAG: DNA-3-methyladenine glycosylase [Patescibacteria group bacterium]|nr:DNA-3-methyladenine glycosylase [Patescibacteria group bacterium]